MSSLFSPEQKNLVLAGAGFFALMGCWLALKAVWNHFSTGNRLRLAPLAVGLLGLLVAVEAVMIVNLHPFFLQHPLRMPSVAMIGLLMVIVASAYDQHHAPPAQKPPSRYYLFRSRVESVLDFRRSLPSDGTIAAHLKSLLRFYLGTIEVQIVSRYDLEQTLSRIRDLNKTGEVYVSEKKPDRLIICATSVRGNVLPLFRGTFNERNGQVMLHGRIEIDSGIVAFLGIFGLILLFMVLGSFIADRTWSERFMGLSAPLVFFLLLEFGHRISKRSPEIIISNLERALRG